MVPNAPEREIRRGPARRPMLRWLAPSLLLLAAAAAGFGAWSREGRAPAEKPPDTAVDTSTAMVAYAQCMRENGVPDFPDPADGNRLVITRTKTAEDQDSTLDPDSPTFQAAQDACRHLLPAGEGPARMGPDPETERQMLSFAQCMRDNGVPDFPDPQFTERGVRVQVMKPKGVDSAAFETARKACSHLLQGALKGAGKQVAP